MYPQPSHFQEPAALPRAAKVTPSRMSEGGRGCWSSYGARDAFTRKVQSENQNNPVFKDGILKLSRVGSPPRSCVTWPDGHSVNSETSLLHFARPSLLCFFRWYFTLRKGPQFHLETDVGVNLTNAI